MAARPKVRMRLAVLLAVVAVFGGTLATAPAASATAHARTTHTRMSWSYVMDHISTWHVGPNRHTRYGRMDFTGTWRTTKSGRKPNFRVTYHPPANPAIRRPANFCWPWEDFSKCKGWNNPESWDWGGLYNDVKPKPLWDMSDQAKCAKGEKKGVMTGIVGKGALSFMLGMGKASVKMTPQGLIVTVIGACLWGVWFN